MIDPALVVSILSFIGMIVFGVITAVHNGNGDVRQQLEQAKTDAAKSARIETTLGSIKNDTGEIRTEQRSIRSEMNDYGRRLVIVEQSTKSAHHRIDRIDDEMCIQHQGGDEANDKLESSN